MLIQCPSCGVQAKLPSSKEGAKVRCPSCQHVYAARPRGAGRSSRKDDPTKYFIIGGAVLASAIIAVIATRGGDDTNYAKPKDVEEKRDTTPFVDPMSWDGPVVSLARDMHKAAFAANEAKLISKFDSAGAYEWEVTKPAPEEEEAAEAVQAEAAPAEVEVAERPDWSSFDEMQRIEWANARVAAALTEGADGVVTGWKPYDGTVISMEGGIAVVHLRVQARDASLALDDRWTRWTFRNLDGESGTDDRWRWIEVDRYLSPEELAKLRNRGKRKAEKKTLSDGSVVYESEIRAIAFDDDVSTEERQRLTGLVDQLVADPDAPPRKRTKVKAEILDAGKTAVPALLSKMAQIVEQMPDNPDQDEDDRVRLNWIHETLRDITGYETTFDVAEAMGGTRERMTSGLKQWFAWYDRKYKRFKGLDEVGDPLADDPDFMPKTPEEQRLYNKALKEQLEEERRRSGGG